VLGVASLLVTALGWGLLYPASKDIVSAGIDGFTATAIRYAAGSMLVAAILLAAEGKTAFRYEGNFLPFWGLGTVGFAGLNFFNFIGVTYSTAEHGTIILALLPMMGMILSFTVEAHRPTRRSTLCIAFAFIGVAIMITHARYDGWNRSSLFGDTLLLAGTFSWAIYTFFIRRYAAWSALRVTALSALPGTVSILAICALANASGLAHVPDVAQLAPLWPQFAILVLTTAVIVTWNAGIRELGAANGMLFVNLVPVLTFLIGAYRGHPISGAEVFGGLVTLSALVANNVLSRSASS
jgi:drug/metabolite transporter (DMT)-like permease